MVYHYTKRATLARLLANEGPAIYVVYLNRYFVIPPWHYLVVTFLWQEQHLWPGLKQFVTNYIKGYENCQRYKINQHPLKLPLQEILVSQFNQLFTQIAMDLITDLPKSKGFDSILFIIDHGLTKGVILIPTMKEVTSEEIAMLLIANFFQRFGIPNKVISDCNPRFIAKLMKAFL